MKINNRFLRFIKRHQRMMAVGLAFIPLASTALADIHLDMLKTRTDTFTNVTVYSRNKTDIFIRHERGIANIKVANLDPQTLADLDSGGAPRAAAGTTVAKEEGPSATETDATTSDTKSKLEAQLRQQMMAGMAALKTFSGVRVNRTVVAMVLGALLAFYLFGCYCLKLICEKTGNEPGFLVWLPVLQAFPMLRAASMSGWWFIGLLLGITEIVWCFKIVQARGKSVWVAIGLLLPGISLISFLYLAFSGGVRSEPRSRKVSIAAPPLPSEA